MASQTLISLLKRATLASFVALISTIVGWALVYSLGAVPAIAPHLAPLRSLVTLVTVIVGGLFTVLAILLLITLARNQR